MAITKCKQSKENIVRMAQAAFPGKVVSQVTELTEGMCNVAYKLTFTDGFQTILKIASPDKSGFMTNEQGLMDAEVKALKLVAGKTDIKVPEVYFYDTARAICEGDYFFMECMEGVNWITVYDSLSEEERADLKRQVGEVQKKLQAVTGDGFGMLGNEACFFDTLFEFVRFMVQNVLGDAEARNVEVGVKAEDILTAMEKDKQYFDMVTVPSLVHWDMWEGNIFIKGSTITGIIDWERAMWGEPFMDEPFRHHKKSRDMLDGFFGTAGELSYAEMRRIYWYDVLLYLTMMTEVFYREYEEDGQYYWAKSLFEEVWELLKQ